MTPRDDEHVLGRRLSKRFRAYGADTRLSTVQLLNTFFPFAALLWAMFVLAPDHLWIALLLAVPAGGLLVRLFIIQHDCGHGSFYKSRGSNDNLGRAISLLTLTPYSSWKQGHAAHHASAGNLDRRGQGDVETWTVNEYLAASPLKRMLYRLYRNPLVMVGIGAPINFVLLQRLPLGRSLRDRTRLRSTLLLDLALLVGFGFAAWALGAERVLSVYLPVIVVASWAGGWLFFVQHQFEAAGWERDAEWDFFSSALTGSSYLKLPRVLQWFSGSIGLHHVHHVCSRVPNYRLQACVDDAPELNDIATVITLRQSVACWRLALWDEDLGRLVSFKNTRNCQAHEPGPALLPVVR